MNRAGGDAGTKPGHLGYATVLTMIRNNRCGHAGLVRRSGFSSRTVFGMTMAMWSAGLIHPVGWTLKVAHYSALWAYGKGDAAPHPAKGIVKAPAQSRSEVIAFAAFIAAATGAPISALELGEESGLAMHTIYRLVNHCLSIRLLHIADWKINAGLGDHAALYMIGRSPDTPKPPPRDLKELGRANMARRYARERAIAMLHRTCPPIAANEQHQVKEPA